MASFSSAGADPAGDPVFRHSFSVAHLPPETTFTPCFFCLDCIVSIMQPTLSDVARAAGVSRQVVSAVLAEGGHAGVRFAPETAAAVRAAVAQVGYRRNRQAMQMRTQRQGAIAVLASNLNMLPPNTLEWLMSLASQRGQLIVLERLGSDELRLLREHYADAVVVFETLPIALRAQLDRIEVPLIEVHSAHPLRAGSIAYDLDDAVAQAVARLRAAACRSFAFVAPIECAHFSCDQRFAALGRQLRRARLPAPQRIDLSAAQPSDPARLAAQLQGIDGVLLNNDAFAPAVYQAAAHVGRRPGQDLHVVGFDASPVASLLQPPVPSLRIVPRLLAETVMQQLDRELAEPGSSTPITLSYVLEHTEAP